MLGSHLICCHCYTTSKQRLQMELRSDIDKHSFEIQFGSSHIEIDIKELGDTIMIVCVFA